MRNSPRLMKIIVMMQVIILVFIRVNYGYTNALWALVPTIAIGLIVSVLIGRFQKDTN